MSDLRKTSEQIFGTRTPPRRSDVQTEDGLLAELRHHERDYPSLIHGPLCGQAADEIESLRAKLARAQSPVGWGNEVVENFEAPGGTP